MAQSKGKIHDVFQQNLEDLTEKADQQAQASRSAEPRPWNRPEKAKDPLDIAGITDAFDRSEIDTNFSELLQDPESPGTCGDVICVKTQGDYVAEIERGFRARHATPVRCICHSMARRKGHSKPNGIFLGGVLVHVQNALKSGQGGGG
jgi:hypothetical protein